MTPEPFSRWLVRYVERDSRAGDVATDVAIDIADGCAQDDQGRPLMTFGDMTQHVLEMHPDAADEVIAELGRASHLRGQRNRKGRGGWFACLVCPPHETGEPRKHAYGTTVGRTHGQLSNKKLRQETTDA